MLSLPLRSFFAPLVLWPAGLWSSWFEIAPQEAASEVASTETTESRGVDVCCTVVDEATGQPVSSVDFWLLEGAEEPRGYVYSEHGPPRDVRTTDGLGRMQFADLPPGVYELSPRPIQPQSAGPGFQLPADDLGWIPAATALFVPAGVRGERMDVVLSVRSGVYLEGGIAVDQMPQAGAEGSRISVCGVLPDGRFACAW